MKSLLLVLLMIAAGFKSLAQEKLPAFRIANADGKYLSSKDVAGKKPVLLIYFQPDCDECRRFTSLLTKNDAVFERYDVVMVTNAGLTQLQKFVVDFKLSHKAGLTIGTEGWTGTLQRQLNISRFPFAALYRQYKNLEFRDQGNPESLYTQIGSTLK